MSANVHGNNSHLRIDARKMRICNGLRKRGQPTVRLPFEGILAPDGLVAIGIQDGDRDFCPVLERNLFEIGIQQFQSRNASS